MTNCLHCERPVYARGFCIAHYSKFRKYGNALEPSHKRTKNTCSVEGCNAPAAGRGLCNAHYKKLRTHGDPRAGKTVPRGVARLERYTSYVDQRGPDECWPWTGGRNEKNYGQFNTGEPSGIAHRYGFSQLVRPLEPGETVDHTCHNGSGCSGGNTCEHRACQNPAHWEAVDNWTNGSRGESFSAVNARKTHCPAGHELTEENTYLVNGGRSRQCKICTKDKAKKTQQSESYKAWKRENYRAYRLAGFSPDEARKLCRRPLAS